MVKSEVIHSVMNSRVDSEKQLGVLFNKWTEDNPGAKIVHLFDPVRRDETYGDRNYNKYHTILTFFYYVGIPNGLIALEDRQ